jgi:hypothetical protein
VLFLEQRAGLRVTGKTCLAWEGFPMI